MLDGTVEPCHADVIKASGAMTQKLESYKSFLSDGMIRGSCSTDSNLKGWMCGRFGFVQGEGERLGGRVIFSFWEKSTELTGFHGIHAGCEDRLASGVKAPNNCCNLGNGLSCPVDDFGSPKALLTLQVEVSERTRQDSAGWATSRHIL
jgi:hypothetical protein